MKTSVLINQMLIVLATGGLCMSHDVYNGDELPSSCAEILERYPAAPSSYYKIQPPNGAPTVNVYCDMDSKRCNSRGWAKIAEVDVENDKSCPGNLTFIESPKPSCGGPTTAGCASANFSSNGLRYSQVCGRVRGYQVGKTNGFGPYRNLRNPSMVVDGILISHGKAQKHIWAYVTGYQQTGTTAVPTSKYICPCTGPQSNATVPPFIGNDYYCDSGVDSDPMKGVFYTTPLWTGEEGCTPPNFCCSRSGMPWFCRTLPVPTTDYIELRSCYNDIPGEEDTALDQIEIYVR